MDTQIDTFVETGLKLSSDQRIVVIERLLASIDNFEVKRLLSKRWDDLLWPQHFADQLQPPEIPLPHSAVQAKQLQEISGLALEHLAEIFAVSPETYSCWLAGSLPSNESCEQLSRVLALFEEASVRLKTPEAMKNWLLTPVEEDSPSPLDFLAKREYGLFHAFILHLPTGQWSFHSPVHSQNWVNPFITPEEFEEAHERLTRSIRYCDEDYPDPEETKEVCQTK